ncbi:MAG TPA: hypothetical protein VNM48_18540 [Chloroflexota bacterium]|jgi:hypothetical protein|nr:hypothetical protein [Chloroflexota bacterium]
MTTLVESALAIVPPSWLLATLLALLNVFVFRLAVGREGHSALYFLPWGVFGFALGNLLAGWAGSVLPALGDVRVIEASAGAWLFLTAGNVRAAP